MSAPQTAPILSFGDLVAMTFAAAGGLDLDRRATARVVRGAVEQLLGSRSRSVGAAGVRAGSAR